LDLQLAIKVPAEIVLAVQDEAEAKKNSALHLIHWVVLAVVEYSLQLSTAVTALHSVALTLKNPWLH
jgi:hypothetical protein